MALLHGVLSTYFVLFVLILDTQTKLFSVNKQKHCFITICCHSNAENKEKTVI